MVPLDNHPTHLVGDTGVHTVVGAGHHLLQAAHSESPASLSSQTFWQFTQVLVLLHAANCSCEERF